MRILIFNWRDLKHEWAGGSEVYITELASRWVEMGHGVTMFCGQDVGRKLPEEEVIDGERIIRRGGRYGVYAWAAWYYLARLRKGCDVVVDVQNGIPFFTPLYSRKPKVCVVHHVHGEQFFVELLFPYSWVGYLVEKWLFPLVYREVPMVAVSQTTKRGLVRLGFPAKNIQLVYNGIDEVHRTNGAKARKFSRPTILYLGRIKKYKRVDMLVETMPEVLKRVPKARLLIAGWGTEGGSVTDTAMRGEVRRKVKIMGPVGEAEKRRLFARAWVFVNPSLQEGWGITVIEANAYRTPAVAFNVPGLSESVKDGVSGLLADDKEELVEKVAAILENGRLRRRLGEGARKWAEGFSWEKSAKKGIRILERVVTGKSS